MTTTKKRLAGNRAAARFRAKQRREFQRNAEIEAKKRRDTARLQTIADRIAQRVITHLTPQKESVSESRWHGAHAAIQALMHAGAIKEQYVLYIREHLAMRKDAIFQINGIAILPPEVP